MKNNCLKKPLSHSWKASKTSLKSKAWHRATPFIKSIPHQGLMNRKKSILNKTPVCFSLPLKCAQFLLKSSSTIRQARTPYVLRFFCRRLLRRRRRLLRRLRRLRRLLRRLLFLKRRPLLLPKRREKNKEMFLQSNWN